MTTIRCSRGRVGPGHDLSEQALWHSTIIVPVCDAGRTLVTRRPLQAIPCRTTAPWQVTGDPESLCGQEAMGARLAEPGGRRQAILHAGHAAPEGFPKTTFGLNRVNLRRCRRLLCGNDGSVTGLIPARAVTDPLLRIYLSFRNPPAVSGVELPNVGWARCRVRGTGQPAAPSNDDQGQAARLAANTMLASHTVLASNAVLASRTRVRGLQAGGRVALCLRIRPGKACSHAVRRAEAKRR
jgi:hypothetical protein